MRTEQVRALIKAMIAVDTLATANGIEWERVKVLQQQVASGGMTESEMVDIVSADLDESIDRLDAAAQEARDAGG